MHQRRPVDRDENPDSMIRPRGGNTSNEDNSAGDPGVALVKALAGRAWQSPKVKSGLGLWGLGMFFMLLAPALYTVTPDQRITYETMMMDAANMPEYQEAYALYADAQHELDEVKVWFWRVREPYKDLVPKRQRVADELQQEVERLDAIREQKMREAKGFVGLWSDFGLAEVRQRFWDAYDKGKLFAQEQTFYNMIMHVLTARDEDMVSMVVHWVFVALMNFTTGLLGSLFYFFFSLVSMVYSYQPDPFSAMAFVVLAFVGAASVIASYLFAMYGMAASSAYVLTKVVTRDALEAQRRQQYLRQQR